MRGLIEKALLDTNLLLLLLVSRVDPLLVLQFKRVRMFKMEDIEILRGLLLPFRGFVTTPHVLAETSNFVHQAPPQWRSALIEELHRYVEEEVEIFTPANELIQGREFSLLGLTDAAIFTLSRRAVVVTADFQLAGRIESAGGSVLNFNDYAA